MRSAGYWIIGCKRLVSSIIQKCVKCRQLRQDVSSQKMSDLPADRLRPHSPLWESIPLGRGRLQLGVPEVAMLTAKDGVFSLHASPPEPFILK